VFFIQSREKFEKLLFPEILTLESDEDAKLISTFLTQYDISSVGSDTQITIEKIPNWMTELPIRTLCFELINLFLKEQPTMANYPATEESALMFLKLLEQCGDIKALKLKRIPKDKIADYFNE